MLSKDQRETDQTQKKGKGYAKPLCFGSELQQTIQCHYTGKCNNTSVEVILKFPHLLAKDWAAKSVVLSGFPFPLNTANLSMQKEVCWNVPKRSYL